MPAYGQLEYEIPIGASAQIDGVLGARYIKTDRTIDTFRNAWDRRRAGIHPGI